MREKLVAGFYGTLSWAVWGVTICGIFFLIFLLCTGHTRRPTVSLDAAVIAEAAETDPELAQRGVSPDGWYTLTMELELKGSPWSPYDYWTSGFHVSDRGALPAAAYFVPTKTKTVFSKAAPAKAVFTLYVRHDGDPAALTEALKTVRFSLNDYNQQLGFLSGEIWLEPAAFSLADFSADVVDCRV